MHEEARVLWTKASIAMIVQILKELMRIWNGLDSHSITEKRVTETVLLMSRTSARSGMKTEIDACCH